jgi:hypothetical protein
VNLAEFRQLVTEMIQLIQELKQTRAQDPAPEAEKLGVWSLLVGVLFGRNPY